jgi:RNA polymerase sigma-70 factor, ECF subfamily
MRDAEIAMTPELAAFEDSVLIKLALAGRAECFTVLIDRHLTAVKRYIRSVAPNVADVDDLIQDVLLKVWRHLATFRSESSFRTWMTRVAMNEALQSYRRERSRALFQPLGEEDRFACRSESPYRTLARAETTKAVRAAIGALPPKHRQVLILHDLEQLSIRETARCIESSIPATKTRIFRARLTLLAKLQRSRTRELTMESG